MKKVIIVSMLSTFIILGTSCGSEDSGNKSVGIEMQQIDGNDVGAKNTFKEREVETTFKGGKLTIGDNVVVSEGQSEYIDFGFPVIKGGKIYKNSNVKKYGFIISEKDTSIETITKYYQTELKKLGWVEEIDNSNQEIKKEEAGDAVSPEQIIDSKSLIFTKSKTASMLDELRININSTIPEILKENYKFEGNYIDFYLNIRTIEEKPLEIK